MVIDMSSSILAPASPPAEPFRRFSVQEYHAMTRAGILSEDDPCELLEGWLVSKMPRTPRMI